MAEPGKRASQIFVSYRRDDSAAVTRRIYECLLQRLGRDVVFKDDGSIPLGVNVRKHIDSIILECDAVIVVIGDGWTGTGSKSGWTRLDDPRDFVRIGIESALRREIPVIPLLVNDAEMPGEDCLPEPLRGLADRNGMSIRHDPHFQGDINRLISNLETILKTPAAATETRPLAVEPARPHAPARVEVSPRQVGQTPADAGAQPLDVLLSAAHAKVEWHVRAWVALAGLMIATFGGFMPLVILMQNYEPLANAGMPGWTDLYALSVAGIGAAIALGFAAGIFAHERPALTWRWGIWVSVLPVYILLIGMIFAAALPPNRAIPSDSNERAIMMPLFLAVAFMTATLIVTSACLGAHLGSIRKLRAMAWSSRGRPWLPRGRSSELFVVLGGVFLLALAAFILLVNLSEMKPADITNTTNTADSPAATNANTNMSANTNANMNANTSTSANANTNTNQGDAQLKASPTDANKNALAGGGSPSPQ